MELRPTYRADQLPGAAGIFAAINAIECSRDKYFWIGGSLCERADRLALHAVDEVPFMTFVLTDVNSAVRLIQSPDSGENALGICFVEENVVDDQRIVRGDLAQPCPVLSIVGYIHPAVGGAE